VSGDPLSPLRKPDEDHIAQFTLGIVGNTDPHDGRIGGAHDILVFGGIEQIVRYVRHRALRWVARRRIDGAEGEVKRVR